MLLKLSKKAVLKINSGLLFYFEMLSIIYLRINIFCISN
jgi:hypothetical protein